MPKESVEPTRRSKRISVAKAAAPKSPPKRSTRRRATKKHAAPNRTSADEDDSSQTIDPTLIVTKSTGGPNPTETNPANVTRPVSGFVHPSLMHAWQINRNLPMCFIFDAISPSLKFKRGMPFDDAAAFPEYQESEAGFITETDGESPAWMPYIHDQYR